MITANILIKNRSIDQYQHNGKTYIEGRKGSEYVIQIKNTSSIRKKVVVSVDGLNVISGDTNWTQGYIINGYETLEIPGWLKNDKQAAKFVFSNISKSYNQHNDEGDKNNVGVIGIIVYNEKQVYHYNINKKKIIFSRPSPTIKPHYEPYWTNVSYNNVTSSPLRSSGISSALTLNSFNENSFNDADRSLSTSKNQQEVGTGWGNNQEFKTIQENFSAENNISQLLELYYDSRKNLEDLGINFKKKVKTVPNAFPGLNNKYCPAPR